MPKLEFTPIGDWAKWNFLGKRFFDVLNGKLNFITRQYVGNGTTQILRVDIIPRLIIIFNLETGNLPVIWIDLFKDVLSKDFAGNNLTDAILGISPKKDYFIIGSSTLVNDSGVDYNFLVIGE